MTATTLHRRMSGEIEIDREPVPGSWLRIVGRFTWAPRATFEMERVASGTCYHVETPTKVREILELYMGKQDVRLSLNYGDVETGEDWLDEFDMEGYIGRSMGPMKSPLLLHNSRSNGGGSILDACIIRIKFARQADRGPDLYRHPLYHADRAKHRDNIPDLVAEERVWNRRFAG